MILKHIIIILPASIIFSSMVIRIHLSNVFIIVISALLKKGHETTDELLGLRCFPTLSATVLKTLNINKSKQIYKYKCV